MDFFPDHDIQETQEWLESLLNDNYQRYTRIIFEC